MSDQLTSALSEWSMLLGSKRVLVGQQLIERYCHTSMPKKWRTHPTAAVLPTSKEEIVSIINIANKYDISLHPISRGQNWGYGGPLPPNDNMVIIDLSKMNRIIDVNIELAYAIIEPGVTQKQLYDYLQEHKIELIPDATGAGPDSTIVGNVLQRGFGHTPYGNRILHVANLEVVLPDGSIIHTGFGDFPNARAVNVFPYGLGPWIDGTFTQSNRGIVTRMTIWLLPKPEQLVGFALKILQDKNLDQVIETLRKLCLNGIIQSTVHIANDLRVISTRCNYPYDITDNQTPLPYNVKTQLQQQYGIGAWNLMGGLYGSKKMVKAAKSDIKHAFNNIAKVYFFNSRILKIAKTGLGLTSKFGIGNNLLETIQNIDSVYKLLHGEPSAEYLKGVFWRHRKTPNPIDISQAGVLWYSPVIPMRGSDVQEIVNIITTVFAHHSLEPLITLSAVTARALVGVISICFDPTDETQITQATECYNDLNRSLNKYGFYPYRHGIQSKIKDFKAKDIK